MGNCLWNVDGFQSGILKGTVLNRRYARGDRYIGQISAVGKCALADGLHTLRQIRRPNAAVGKCAVVNCFQALGEVDLGQATTVRKGPGIYRFHCAGELHGCQIRAAIKGLFFDPFDSLRDNDCL